ncbi:MAG TPA: UDP-N-acetylmuramate dehydrogenase [Turneriella sp.]|nr:UDP-N-acetylmuramate dehydrogenase [Turneriella sp.]HNE18783.1 UDP-N-acetylmuramate dehydrogenase [Turneriella sp.]HNM99144.1 UDP-N-acetylmuramate dehydrogenase [Turneriella sp.]
MADLRAVTAFLDSRGIAYRLGEPLHTYTTFRIGGPADIFVLPRNADELAQVQQQTALNDVPVFLLGGGSNLLVADAGFRGVVVHPDLGEEPEILHRSADRLVVRVPASARAPLAGKKISALGYGGLEFLTTIPGHFGGSVIQNAGCYGHELRDSLVTVEAVRTGQVATVSNASCEFAYRDSIFKRDNSAWIASATLELAAGDSAAIAARIEDYKNRRIASQPKNRRSAGSIFKNPAPGVSPKKAWQLIDEAGLRGVSQGGAEISAEHCNFIVNNGSGSAADVLHLIHLIEQRVYDTCGVRLEKEVVLVGF